MTELNPRDYRNGEPVAPLTIGETVSSASPAVELGNSKAILAAVTGGIVAAGGVFLTAISDGVIDLGEAYGIIGAGLAGAGIPGFAAFLAPTSVTRKV